MSQNLFIDTHAELHELNTALQELQDEYKSNIDYDDNNIEKDYEENILPIDDNEAQSIFTNTQIGIYKIWSKVPLRYEESEIPETQEQFDEKLVEQDVDALQKNSKLLLTCCSKKCLIDNIINYEVAIKKFSIVSEVKQKSAKHVFIRNANKCECSNK
jgi:hypothetical protein